jgi:RND family efflux transporter MFP subunit
VEPGAHSTREGATRSITNVELATVTVQDVPRQTVAPGAVEAWARVSPGTKILGRIQEVPVREGDRVEAGQILARLEDRDLRAAVEQARAGLAMAEARLENARAQNDRMTALRARKSVPEKSLEDAVAAHRVAEAAVEQARANLQAAEVALSYATIKTPVGGWVVERRVEAGDMAPPGAPLFTIDDLSRVKVSVSVPESQVVGLKQGDPAQVTVDVLEATFPARVHRVIPAGDPASRTFQVQVALDNRDGRMRSGMFARALFLRGTRQALLVPGSALVRRGALEGIFIEEDGVARLRWVKVRPAGDGLEILSGVVEGERYLASPPAGLADGTPVAAG